MIKKGGYYFIRPCVIAAWQRPKNNFFNLEKFFKEKIISKARLISILKNEYVFNIEEIPIKVKMPCFAVEILKLVNNPMNITWLLKEIKPILRKYCQKGFKSLSTDELRILLSWRIYKRYYQKPDFALNTAAGFESCYRDRGDIIRALRNSYSLRDTSIDRNYYRQFIGM